MKAFKEYLLERRRLDPDVKRFRQDRLSRWQVILKQRKLPIYLERRVVAEFNEMPDVYTIHIAGANERRLRHILSSAKTQKGLSTSTHVERPRQILEGIASGAGAVYVVKGYPAISAPIDIYSEVDKEGVRYFDLKRMFKEIAGESNTTLEADFESMYEKKAQLIFKKELPEFYENFKYRAGHYRSSLNDALSLEINAFTPSNIRYLFGETDGPSKQKKAKQIAVRAYYEMIKPFLSKHKQTIMGIASPKAIFKDRMNTGPGTGFEAVNEIVMNDYEIDHVLLYETYYHYTTDYKGELIGKSPVEVYEDFKEKLEEARIPYSEYDKVEEMARDANDFVKSKNDKILK